MSETYRVEIRHRQTREILRVVDNLREAALREADLRWDNAPACLREIAQRVGHASEPSEPGEVARDE